MLYPQKINAKKSDLIIRIFMIVSIAVGILLTVINKMTTPLVHWAAIANSGIIYTWVITIYSVKRNVNIAGHTLLQFIATSFLVVFIDYKLGFKAWSIDIAIPMIIITANFTMLVLTIVGHRRFVRYAIYQLVIVILSFIPIFLVFEDIFQVKILTIIATGISILNLILSLALCSKAIKEAIVRKFHM